MFNLRCFDNFKLIQKEVEKRDLFSKFQECPTQSAVLRVRTADGSCQDSWSNSRTYRVWRLTGQDMHTLEHKVITRYLSFCFRVILN